MKKTYNWSLKERRNQIGLLVLIGGMMILQSYLGGNSNDQEKNSLSKLSEKYNENSEANLLKIKDLKKFVDNHEIEVAKYKKGESLMDKSGDKSPNSTSSDAKAEMGILKSAITQFNVLSEKPFASELEKKILTTAVESRELIDGAKEIMLEKLTNLNDENITNHLDASKFLLTALKGPERASVLSNIELILTDNTIEQKNSAPDVIRFVAGDRAELIYGLIQDDPKSVDRLKSILPGAISQKILKNTLKYQAIMVSEADSQIAKLRTLYNVK